MEVAKIGAEETQYVFNAKKLRETRRINNITTQDVASKILINRKYVSEIERGIRYISMEDVRKLVKYCGAKIEEIIIPKSELSTEDLNNVVTVSSKDDNKHIEIIPGKPRAKYSTSDQEIRNMVYYMIKHRLSANKVSKLFGENRHILRNYKTYHPKEYEKIVRSTVDAIDNERENTNDVTTLPTKHIAKNNKPELPTIKVKSAQEKETTVNMEGFFDAVNSKLKHRLEEDTAKKENLFSKVQLTLSEDSIRTFFEELNKSIKLIGEVIINPLVGSINVYADTKKDDELPEITVEPNIAEETLTEKDTNANKILMYKACGVEQSAIDLYEEGFDGYRNIQFIAEKLGIRGIENRNKMFKYLRDIGDIMHVETTDDNSFKKRQFNVPTEQGKKRGIYTITTFTKKDIGYYGNTRIFTVYQTLVNESFIEFIIEKKYEKEISEYKNKHQVIAQEG